MMLRGILLVFALISPAVAEAVSFDCVLPDEILSYRVRPHCDGHGQLSDGSRYDFHTNALGLKTRDYPPRAAPGVSRLVLVGDSFTTDIGVHGVGAELERSLRSLLKPMRVEVVNTSVSGYNIIQQYLLFQRSVPTYSPNLVVVNSMFSVWWLTVMASHDDAIEHGPDGLVSKLGTISLFWPLPRSWGPVLWPYVKKVMDPQRLRVFCQGLRLSIWKSKFWLRSFYTDRTVLVNEVYERHLAYLRAMRGITEASGAKFVVANVIDRRLTTVAQHPRSRPFLWYQPDHYAELLPLRVLPADAMEKFTERLKAEFTVVDVSDAPRFDESLSPLGFMYDPVHREMVARNLAPALAPIVRKLGPGRPVTPPKKP